MLKRIYIDNFRCLVDFELEVQNINLFVGRSGMGKSTVFKALRKIQAFVTGDKGVAALFQPDDLTRFSKSPIQKFELEVVGNGGTYKYQLATRHDEANKVLQVASECLWFDDKPLLIFEEGVGQLYADDYSESVAISGDVFQSAVASFSSERYPNLEANAALTWFRERMKRFIIVQPIPKYMERTSRQPEAQLTAKMENFVSWYRYVSLDKNISHEITEALKNVFYGLVFFKFSDLSEQETVLSLGIADEASNYKPIEYRFYEIADGERALIALYTLIEVARSKDVTLCIENPTDFIALPVVRPWLTRLLESCRDGDLQALFISHHPLLIDELALSAGYWFDREHENSKTWVTRLTEKETLGLRPSTMVATGWILNRENADK